MSALHIIRPGLLTTVQDLGRWGAQAIGVPVAGPMDPFSHRLANALVGNDSGSATLEVTLMGPEIAFEDERLVAVTGAQFDLSLGGQSAPSAMAVVARAGSRLIFSRRLRGTRAYLAVAGGVAVPQVLGSRATHVLSRMGGFRGRALASGDQVPLGHRAPAIRLNSDAARGGGAATWVRSAPAPKPGPESVRVLPDRHARVRVLPGPHHDRFDDQALDRLQSAPYTIGNDSDRMGFRLSGPTLRHERDTTMISDATSLGVLQVPASGQPVLLMADRQTTGGYPTIATLISADIGLAGQLGPGDTISFVACSRREALAALIAQERALMAAEGASRP